jgi:cysteine desulfurase
MRVYLDNASTTPLDKEVLQEMVNVMENFYGNPSSIHAHGREGRTLIEKARKVIASHLNASPAEFFFTSGGTEADNAAIRCAIADHQIKHAITSEIEHYAVLHTLQALENNGDIKLSYVNIDKKGNVDLSHLQELLQTNERSLVSLMHGNNEIGNITDIALVGEICEQYQAIFHCDTVQTMGHYPFDLSKLKVHLLVCSAHKLYGPKGVGFLYINHNIKISPFIYGGAQERNMRGGTENIYGIVGLAKAFQIAHQDMSKNREQITELKQYMIDQLLENIPGIEFNGETDPDKSLFKVLNVSFPETDLAEMLLFNLDIAGISVSGGSACSSGTNIGSHVLTGIRASEVRPAVRFSFSKYNNRQEIDYVIEQLKDIFSK